ncbi:Detected protein of unknown function [Hibiscus syriacus]|uniref:CCHC-type domain-containing protein n=1 Tax=Hibiscus syriacus TaxID=106335 RepID=A0A6A2YPI6_HIBSY|nr:Detected protein of unknown function [Hibiscus syriacus]
MGSRMCFSFANFCFLFANLEHALDFFPPEVSEGTATIKPPSAVFEEGIAEWSYVMVVNLLVLLLILDPFRGLLRFSEGSCLRSRGGLSYIATVVGIPLYMDYVTTSKERLEFAKVWVEVEDETLLPNVINVVLQDGSVVIVRVYAQWFPKFYTHCKSFGHQTYSCAENTKAKGKIKDNMIWRRKENPILDFLEKSDNNVNVVANTTDMKVGDAEELPVQALQECTIDMVQVIVEDNTGISQNLVKTVSDVTDKNLQLSVDQVVEGLSGVATEKFLPSVDQMIISFWNVRGLNNGLKKEKVFRILENLGVGVLCFMETRVRRVNFPSFSEVLDADWNLADNYEFSDGGRLWMVITAVYGSNNSLVMRGLWAHLKSLESDVGSSSWVFGEISTSLKVHKRVLTLPRVFQITVLVSFGLRKGLRRLEEESKLRANLVALEDAESEFYKQRAKVHWLQKGDLNTRFFHQRIEVNKKRNTIKVIKDDSGIYHESFENMAAVLEKFFKDLIGTADSNVKGYSAEWLKSVPTYSIPSSVADVLTVEITNAEIKDALFRQGNNKSPGPDGYTSWFFKAAWEIVCNDFLNTVRPISCYSVIYKTITRILASRLALFFPDMISPNQSAFVKGRNIADNTLLAEEIVKGYSRKNLSPSALLRTLEKFYELSCLKLNALKSELFAYGVARDELEVIESANGFKLGQLSLRYLGVPLVTRKLTSKDCSALLVKIKGRIDKWSSMKLNFGGRLQLVKVVILQQEGLELARIGMAHKYTSKEDKRWSRVSEANNNCPYKENLVVGLRIMWVGGAGAQPLRQSDDSVVFVASLLRTHGESSQADSLYVKGNRDRGRKPEKAGSGKRNSRSKSRDKKTIHCYKCKEAGHMKRDCPKLKKQTDEKRDGSSKSVNVVEDDNSDCSEGDMLSISMTQLTDAWILDSGCSYNITPNREWFSTYRPVNSGSVYLGDDRCCNIVGIGDVRIKMHDGSVRTLSGVRHIPDLKKNLISLGTLQKNGFIPKADEDRETIRIVKGALTVMKGKMTAGNIYRLLGSTVTGGVHSVESCDDTTKLWHMRLAHLSERGMEELHKRNLLHGVKSCKLDFCKYCVLGKQTKVRFKTAKHTTQGILDYVHSDIHSSYNSVRSMRFRGFYNAQDTTTECVSERMKRSLNERARCLRLNAGLPKHFWAEAVNMACYLINNHQGHRWLGKLQKYGLVMMLVLIITDFGCPAYVHAPADERSKLDAKSKECIFLGYKKGQKQDTTVVDFEQFPVEKTRNFSTTSGGSMDDLQDYSLARDRVTAEYKASEQMGFEDLVSLHLFLAVMDGSHEEQIYMRQPEGFTQPGNEHLVCRLKKSLYGLKQSPRQWYKRFDSYMIKIGYNRWTETQGNCGYLNGCPKTDKEAEDMAKVSYSNAVGCLMYAMVCTRPDLAHIVSQVCKYMSKPGKQHWEAVKWIFRYLKGTVGHGIVFGSQRDNPLVVGYVDSDYAGDLDNRRSTTGYVFTLGGGLICWKSIVQSVVALSITEAEYMAAAEAAKEALWLTGLVKELGVQQGNPTHIEVSKGQDIRQGGDLLGMAHKYTSKEDRMERSERSEHQLSLQRKSRCGDTNYVGWGYGGACLAIAWVKTYCFKSVQYWEFDSKAHFSLILCKLIKMREEARRLSIVWPICHGLRAYGFGIISDKGEKLVTIYSWNAFMRVRFGVQLCSLVVCITNCRVAGMMLYAGWFRKAVMLCWEESEIPPVCLCLAFRYIERGEYERDLNSTISMIESFFKTISPSNTHLDVVLVEIDDILASDPIYSYQFNLQYGSNKPSGSIEDAIDLKQQLTMELCRKLESRGWPLIILLRKSERQRNVTIQHLKTIGFRSWSSLIMSDELSALRRLLPPVLHGMAKEPRFKYPICFRHGDNIGTVGVRTGDVLRWQGMVDRIRGRSELI